MKKIILTILTLAMLACIMLPMTALADGESFELYFTFDKEFYEVGDTVTVQMHLDRTDSDADYTMYYFSGGAIFDKVYLDYVDSSKNANNAAGMRVTSSAIYYNSTLNSIGVNYHGLTSPLTRGAKLVLAELQFTALQKIRSATLYNAESSVSVVANKTASLTATNGVYIIGNPNVPTFAVAFDAGADSVTGTAPAAVEDKAEGDLLVLPACSWTRKGYTFAGWSDGKTTFATGAQYTMSAANVSFTAQWTRDPVKRNISFTAGNLPAGRNTTGQAPEPRQLYPSEKLSLPTQNTLTLIGYSFEGWSLDDELYQPGDVYTVPDGNSSFAAVWKSIDAGTTIGGGGTFVPADDAEPQQPWTSPFSDVRESDWFYEYVKYANEKNLMGGTENDLFAPMTPMNRAMMVTVLYRAAGSPAVTAANFFSDVPTGTWYTDAVIWAASEGIVNGVGDDRFAPLQTLNRQEMVTMLWRWLGEPQGTDFGTTAAMFGDWNTVADWAREAFAWAAQQEIVNGIDGNAVPNGTASRAQFAAVMARADVL